MGLTDLPKDLNIDTEAKLQLFGYRNPENLSTYTISFLRTGLKDVPQRG